MVSVRKALLVAALALSPAVLARRGLRREEVGDAVAFQDFSSGVQLAEEVVAAADASPAVDVEADAEFDEISERIRKALGLKPKTEAKKTHKKPRGGAVQGGHGRVLRAPKTSAPVAAGTTTPAPTRSPTAPVEVTSAPAAVNAPESAARFYSDDEFEAQSSYDDEEFETEEQEEVVDQGEIEEDPVEEETGVIDESAAEGFLDACDVEFASVSDRLRNALGSNSRARKIARRRRARQGPVTAPATVVDQASVAAGNAATFYSEETGSSHDEDFETQSNYDEEFEAESNYDEEFEAESTYDDEFEAESIAEGYGDSALEEPEHPVISAEFASEVQTGEETHQSSFAFGALAAGFGLGSALVGLVAYTINRRKQRMTASAPVEVTLLSAV